MNELQRDIPIIYYKFNSKNKYPIEIIRVSRQINTLKRNRRKILERLLKNPNDTNAERQLGIKNQKINNLKSIRAEMFETFNREYESQR